MEAKPTPGPWFTKREGFSTVYVEARISGGMLQEVAACGPTQAGSEQQEANARLIAAAPELLEAAKEFEKFAKLRELELGTLSPEMQLVVEMTREAIAKATS